MKQKRENEFFSKKIKRIQIGRERESASEKNPSISRHENMSVAMLTFSKAKSSFFELNSFVTRIFCFFESFSRTARKFVIWITAS